MMNKSSIYLFCILFVVSQVKAQVIYERTYPDAFPSIKNPIELSDYSTVSFAYNSPCYFGGWRHISSTGDIINEGGLGGESMHSLRTKQIAPDSILVSYRTGPLDYNGDNYFKVVLWTPDSMTTLVLDSLSLNYWDDCEWCNTPIHYEVFLIHDHHVLYQQGDTVFSKNLITGHVDFRETFTYITKIYPIKDGLLIFSEGFPPTYFNSKIEQIKTLISLENYPFVGNLVSLDSFIVGSNFDVPTILHTINVFNEYARDIDLSAYFTRIESLVVRGDTLIVAGRNGATGITVQLNKYFQILYEKPFVYPDSIYSWELSFYPDRLYAWRTDGLSGYRADYRVAYSYLDPQPITYVDLALIDISVDSVFLWSPSLGSPYILVLSASIVNRSADTLQSLTLHYQEEPFQFCDPGVYPAHFKDLETPPGDTAMVKIWAIVWADQIDEPFVRTFFVQHGNHHLDSNRTDNSFRFDSLISSSKEPIRAYLTVYPNPFKDFLRIDNIPETSQMILLDQTGRMVSVGYGRLDNLGGLPIGVYLLQIIDGNSISIQRVVKVE